VRPSTVRFDLKFVTWLERNVAAIHKQQSNPCSARGHQAGLTGTDAGVDGVVRDLPVDRAIVCITGDHATPAFPDVIHSGDPVPFVVAGPGVRADRVSEFGESSCANGIFGHLRGPDMMPVLLNAADRPLFLGSRPTPFDGADGYPSILDPL